MEIVTEPEIRTAEQARRYAEELQLLLRSIGASDADMERGQLRVEANVSLRPRGTEPFGTRVEVKNMNSFRAVERAIEFEIERQAAALDAGEALRPGDPRLVGGARRDLPDAGQGDVRRLPLLPGAGPAAAPRRDGLAGRRSGPRCRSCPAPAAPATGRRSGSPPYDAAVLVADPDASALFEATTRRGPGAAGQVGRELGHRRLPADCGTPAAGGVSVRPAELAAIIAAVEDGSISRANGREVLEAHVATGDPAAAIIEARGFRQISDAGALAPVVDGGAGGQPGRGGRLPGRQGPGRGFLVGQVMKATRGQANAAMAGDAVRSGARTPTRQGRADQRWGRSTSSCGSAGSS